MLKSITIENFFSFGEAQKIELNSGVNILIGINGSGKSNFIRALRLLLSLWNNSFRKLFMQEWGGFDNVAFDSHRVDIPIRIIYEFNAMDIKIIEVPNLYYEILIYRNSSINYNLKGVCYTIDKDSTEKKILSSHSEFESTRSAQIFSNSPLLPIENELKCYEKFDVSEKSALRKAGDNFIENYLLPNGINLYALLNDLNINQSKAYDEIEKHLQEVNPNFKNIISKPLGSKFLYFLKEKGLEKAIDFQFISDGTLQYLLLLSIFYNPKRGKLVTLDEPDNNLHPDMINGIAKGIKHAAVTGTQMIIATHSPLLLNSFEYEDLIIFEKDDKNQTITSEISDETIEKWASYPVGQMWISGQLGGVRW